ncbi:MAG: hypothetical protein RLO50_03510 [Azospirillaceae bacterium]
MMFETLAERRPPHGATAERALCALVDEHLFTQDAAEEPDEAHLAALRAYLPVDLQDGVAIVLYQPGEKRLLVVRSTRGFEENLVSALAAVRRHSRFGAFDPARGARVQIDFFRFTETGLALDRLSDSALDETRFEYGVDGLRLRAGGKSHYFLPGDGYVRSVQTITDVAAHLRRLAGKDAKAIEGVDRIRSESVISFGRRWLPLYRGHPSIGAIADSDVEAICALSIGHIVGQFRADDRFLYYYDAAKDSARDHQHPKRDPVNDPYYNELRHCGGIIALLLWHQAHPDPALIRVARRAIDFVERISVAYTTPDGRAARYLYYNRKAKLGGTGLALYSLAMFERVTGDSRYRALAHEFAEHLIAEVSETGEFRYYSIYLDRPIAWAENVNYFSFYYPGEALIGLATYLKWIGVADERREEFATKINAALRYLLFDRPVERASEYSSLPSDAWLMAAINELHDLAEFRDPAYADFVFGEARAMIAQMYDDGDAICPDYVGAFYYQYGDKPYPDGARCEGMVAALALAEKLGDQVRVDEIGAALVRTIHATIRLANTPESLYFAPNPEKAAGGVRFKMTRQWFRIDTIQHVICYYIRFLEVYRRQKALGFQFSRELAPAEGADVQAGAARIPSRAQG